MKDFMAQFGARLVDNGYPVIPIMPGAKVPGHFRKGAWAAYPDWTRHCDRATKSFEIDIWRRWPDCAVGIACGAVVGIDIDVPDASVAVALTDRAKRMLGETPCLRIGQAPKRLLVYRAATAFRGRKRHPLEVLARGQQFVAYAIHPVTGQPYAWPEDGLTDTPLADLPEITEAACDAFLDAAWDMVPAALRKTTLHMDSPSDIWRGPSDPRGTPEAVAAALAYLPNDDLPGNEWITWDQALLRDALASVQAAEIDLTALGFSADELAGILAAAGDAVSDGDAPEALSADTAENPAAPAISEDADDPADAEPEAPRQFVSRPGDLWLLGVHRLLCGDSTDAATVARVMENDRAAMLFTSPPYGNQRAYTTGGVSDWDALMQGVFQHLDAALRPDGQALINLGLIHRENEWQPYWEGWLEWMRARGWRRFGLYTWDQGPGLPGDWNGRLAPAFELVFHFNRTARQANKMIPCK